MRMAKIIVKDTEIQYYKNYICLTNTLRTKDEENITQKNHFGWNHPTNRDELVP